MFPNTAILEITSLRINKKNSLYNVNDVNNNNNNNNNNTTTTT
jgi:hypothetical protein